MSRKNTAAPAGRGKLRARIRWSCGVITASSSPSQCFTPFRTNTPATTATNP